MLVPIGQETKSGSHRCMVGLGHEAKAARAVTTGGPTAWGDRTVPSDARICGLEGNFTITCFLPSADNQLQIPTKLVSQPWLERFQSCVFTEANFQATAPNTRKTFLKLIQSFFL